MGVMHHTADTSSLACMHTICLFFCLQYFYNISKFQSIVLRLIVGLYCVKQNSDLQYLQCWQLATSRPFYLSFFRFEFFCQESDTTWPTRFQLSKQKLIFGPESKTSSERMRKMERRSVHSLYLIFHIVLDLFLYWFSFCVCVCTFLYCFISSFCFVLFSCFVIISTFSLFLPKVHNLKKTNRN